MHFQEANSGSVIFSKVKKINFLTGQKKASLSEAEGGLFMFGEINSVATHKVLN
jgi:hypothetical protein